MHFSVFAGYPFHLETRELDIFFLLGTLCDDIRNIHSSNLFYSLAKGETL